MRAQKQEQYTDIPHFFFTTRLCRKTWSSCPSHKHLPTPTPTLFSDRCPSGAEKAPHSYSETPGTSTCNLSAPPKAAAGPQSSILGSKALFTLLFIVVQVPLFSSITKVYSCLPGFPGPHGWKSALLDASIN
mmetsp:Transcript_136176/g.236240  ORF Transcript_136176/g.236240 Transcript_136176/m.236240 type:complete len:132 (-) Transcript_136176:84-479(-)